MQHQVFSPCWYHEAHSNAVVGMQGWIKCVSVPTTLRTATKNKLKYVLNQLQPLQPVVGTPSLFILASIPTTAMAGATVVPFLPLPSTPVSILTNRSLISFSFQLSFITSTIYFSISSGYHQMEY